MMQKAKLFEMFLGFTRDQANEIFLNSILPKIFYSSIILILIIIIIIIIIVIIYSRNFIIKMLFLKVVTKTTLTKI